MIVFGVSTTFEQEERHSETIVRCSTARFFAGLVLQSHSTELHVDTQGLSATGDLGGYKDGRLHLPWDRVRELHFAPQGVGEIGGLYAREGNHCSRCILPRLSEPQSQQIIAVIAHRLPFPMRSIMTGLEYPMPFPPPPYRTSAKSLRLLPPGPTL